MLEGLEEDRGEFLGFGACCLQDRQRQGEPWWKGEPWREGEPGWRWDGQGWHRPGLGVVLLQGDVRRLGLPGLGPDLLPRLHLALGAEVAMPGLLSCGRQDGPDPKP